MFCALCALAALGRLKSLDYSRTDFVFLESENVFDDDAVTGGIDWDPRPFVSAPELQPFRTFVATNCPMDEPVEKATCIVRVFAQRFPHGATRHDPFERSYDPAGDLQSHMAGEPGHCVSRSSLAATALLSVGIRARVMQLVPVSGGHTVMSVFDPAHRRWVTLDPTFMVSFDPLSLLHGENPRLTSLGPLPAGLEAQWIDRYYAPERWTSPGQLVFPEPWLHARVGSKRAPFPFSARFLVIGGKSKKIGNEHTVLRWIILIFGAGVAASLLTAVFASRPSNRGAEALADKGRKAKSVVL